MKKFSSTCTCGEKITVESDDEMKAFEMMKLIMTPEKIVEHMAQKHAGQIVPTPDQAYAMMKQTIKEEQEPPVAN